MNYKIVYIDNEIAENLVSEIHETEFELRWVKAEFTALKCKRCKAYMDLKKDYRNLNRYFLHLMDTLDRFDSHID